ncbi:uncharacterized protein PFL1_01953 [Pseudozyma flocculosa PF-1]|uniref:WD40 repeat-like protein n=1 Tax=Pseudozyma flocculosa TaxID=84751 RepID=A0A5C3EZ00_9BASI|nr:uncharacterized protein PFL1_01953 [Pseudozyma flocculosa PF-1]EPQ30427.1 hypothetical protein PFL1_01953 [Pseudozyma flocculosa PF-1]SPO37504.1 uncharacterized protein PSFLO_02979 [Pseudozyma flocculosa]
MHDDNDTGNASGSSPLYANGSSSTNGHLAERGESSSAARATELASNGTGNGVKSSLSDSDDDDLGRQEAAFVPLWPGSAIDKRELVRLTLQSLRDLGFESSAKALEAESGLTLEHPSITAFRGAVLSGDWRNAERLLIDGLNYAARKASRGHVRIASNGGGEPSTLPLDSVLRRPDVTGLDSIRFMIQRQRYLELLEARQTKKALSVLRDRLTPINQDTEQLHLLSSLVMCANPEELQRRADWDGSRGESRRRLLVDIESAVSPTVMVPSRRLPALLEQAQHYQKQQDPFFNLMPDAHISLLTDHESDRSAFPSEAAQILRGHHDEVWHLEFSHDGTKLATTGRDKYVIVWSVEDEYRMLERFGPHSDPVSSISWSPDDETLLATSESDVTLWSVGSHEHQTFSEHDYTVGTAAWLPDGRFVSGGMDGKIIFWSSRGSMVDVINTSPFRVVALAVSPNGRHLVAVSNRDSAVTTAGQTSAGRSSHNQHAPSSSTTGSSQYSESPSPASTSAGHHAGLPERTGRGHAVEDIGGGSRTMSDEKHRIHFIDIDTREEVGAVYMHAEMSSVCISRDSRFALINHRPDEVQLWNIERQTMVRKFTGHAMQQHVVRCGFGGIDENFVVSGSEDSQVYVWHRPSGRSIEVLSGHEAGTVNAVAWHPKDPSMLASCGDDHTVIIWGPGGKRRRRGGVAGRLKEEADPASDDSLMSSAANPFPWTDVSSPTAHEPVGAIEAMDEAL